MGVTIAAMAGTLLLLRFPMWGSMLRGPSPQGRQGGEEAYYLQVGAQLCSDVSSCAQVCVMGQLWYSGTMWLRAEEPCMNVPGCTDGRAAVFFSCACGRECKFTWGHVRMIWLPCQPWC